MKGMARQRGLTMISWLVVIAVVVFIVMIALKLFPIYLEHFSVQSSMKSLASESEPMTSGQIRQTLGKRLAVNNVDQVNLRDSLVIDRRNSQNVIKLDYEVRVPFVGNVDFVVSFHEQAEVPAP